MDKSLSLIINIYTIVNKYTFIILIFITIMCVNTFYTLDVSKRFVQSIDANAIKIPLWSFKTFCTEQLHILRVIFDTVSQTRKKYLSSLYLSLRSHSLLSWIINNRHLNYTSIRASIGARVKRYEDPKRNSLLIYRIDWSEVMFGSVGQIGGIENKRSRTDLFFVQTVFTT